MEDGRSHRSPQAIENYVQRYYAALYSNDAVSDGNLEARADCLACVPRKVTPDMSEQLTVAFSNTELRLALNDVPAHKAPGHDTIPPELLKEIWGVAGDDLTTFLTECMEAGTLPKPVKYGLTLLIPKGGETVYIRNYRPISVLTGLYKLTAKVLANRLQPILPSCILPSQTAFVKNRSILDNVFLANEAVHWSRESGQSTVILLLDFEKAYDRVNWQFLEAAMEKLGFSATWIKWTSALYRNASSSIIVNGKRLPKFPIERSVRQGCPFAPYLYLIISDVLDYIVNSDVYGIKGLRLPDGSTVRISCFADDTALYLTGIPENLRKAFLVIEKFGAASGAKLNWDKSRAIWASSEARTWSWGEELGLQWVAYGDTVRYLGFPFGANLAPKDLDGKVLLQVRTKLNAWGGKRLSLAARVLVANQVVLASIWYLASCRCISQSALLKVRTQIRNFI